ncbi:kynureninase [bacterium]|nr:kynureninase [bacterium]
MEFQIDKAFAEEMDARDPLAAYREQFHLPKSVSGGDCIYLCGNSLGLQPKSAMAYVQKELQDWAEFGVEGHFQARSPWLPYHEFLTDQTARLVGAKPIEVVVMNTLTVNLHLMMVSFYRPTPDRHKILMEANAFPSDQYAVQSQIKFHGFEPETSLIEIRPQDYERTIRTEDIERLLKEGGESIAMVMLGGVNYYSGQAFEMERITRAGHEHGCIVGFDLAHAAGNVFLNLHDWNVDFAVWCSYKYLNGGPGCLGGCFVHERFAQDLDLPRFAGWWGQNKQTRFLMGREFQPITGAEGWQVSNPPIFSLAALRASMEIFDEVGMQKLRAKSEALTAYLEFLITDLSNGKLEVITPADKDQRGCQLSIRIPKKGKEIFRQLKERGVICDWREPDVIRVAPVPLYNTFRDVYAFAKILSELLTRA